ncbi:MAG: hypothetical protein ACLU22_02875 [Clostridium sp.]
MYLRYSIFLIVHEEWQLKSGHMLYPEEAWRGETHLAGSRQYRPVQEFCHHFQQKKEAWPPIKTKISYPSWQ